MIFAFLFWPLGIIFGIIALVIIHNNPNQKGKGLAIAGIIISVVVFPFLIFIGSLAYFNVLNPQDILPDRCDFSSQIICQQATITEQDNSIIMKAEVMNNLGTDITILDTESSCGLYNNDMGGVITISSPELNGGANAIITCTIDSYGASHPSLGEHAKIISNIAYYPSKQGPKYKKMIKGEVFERIQ